MISDRLSAYINVSTSKREPSSNDLYDDSDVSVPAAVADPYGGTVTDPLISHESLLDLEFGTEYLSENLSVSLNAYRMDFRNELIPIYYRYTDGDDVLRGNAPKTLHQGLELAFSAQVNKFDIRGNMTLSDNHFVEFTADSLGWGGWGGIADYAGKTIPAFPAFQAKARVAYKHDKFQPWLNIKYVGKQYIDFMNTESSAIQPYFVADLGIRFPFYALRMDQVIDIRVNNVFNALYETFGYTYYNNVDDRVDSYWPAATRSFYLTWSFSFDAK
jgi:outer membrane receptor for Fe3+-dicitrate